jgi:hypothetical protein
MKTSIIVTMLVGLILLPKTKSSAMLLQLDPSQMDPNWPGVNCRLRLPPDICEPPLSDFGLQVCSQPDCNSTFPGRL